MSEIENKTAGYAPTAADICSVNPEAWMIGNRPATPAENERLNANVAHGNAAGGFVFVGLTDGPTWTLDRPEDRQGERQ